MKFKRAYDFLVYYFNNIMELGSDQISWTKEERVKEIRSLIKVYRGNFKVSKYSDVQIWKHIKRMYWEFWDDLHFDMMEYEKNYVYNKNRPIGKER